MDHSYIEEHQIADRYLMGKLPADEAARFEEHYLACDECRDRLDLAEALRDGVKRLAAEEVARAVVARRLGVGAWLGRVAHSRSLGLVAAALLLAIALPLGLLYQRERDLRSELAGRLEQTLAPQANVPIVTLGSQRAAPGAAPVDQIRLPDPPGFLVLAVDLAGADHPFYQAILRGENGEEIWKSAPDLLPDQNGTLALSLHSSYLPPGDYQLQILALPTSGNPLPITRQDFRTLPARP